MHQIVTLVAIILFSIFLQSSPSWSLVISNEQGVKELLQNNAEPTVNNNINTITSDKTLVEEESKYSCFPWIFNPGTFKQNYILVDKFFLKFIARINFNLLILYF